MLTYVQVHVIYRGVYIYLYILMCWQGSGMWHFLTTYTPLVSWKQQLMAQVPLWRLTAGIKIGEGKRESLEPAVIGYLISVSLH